MYQFSPNQPYRDLFWKIKKSDQHRVVLDVHRKNLYECLKHVSRYALHFKRYFRLFVIAVPLGRPYPTRFEAAPKDLQA